MRVKRQKIHRRSIRFYKTCGGFREPFKVLCDGTFLHHLLTHKMGSPNDHLSRLLSAPTRPFITRCVIAELKKLGNSFSGTLSAAHKLDSAKCNHEPLKSGSECLESLTGDGNSEHFWVATQDAELRVKLRQLPAVPIILAQNNYLVLEPPSEKQQNFAHASEAQRTHASERELEILEAQRRKRDAARLQMEETPEFTGEDPGAGPNHLVQLSLKGRNVSEGNQKGKKGLIAKDRPQFKKKRAKGPNPLSCKKSKKPAKMEGLIKKEQGADGEMVVKKRKHRNRKKVSKV